MTKGKISPIISKQLILKRVFAAALSIIMIFALFGCSDEKTEKEIVEVSAAELSQAFIDDHDSAMEKYENKTLYVTGEIALFATYQEDRANISLSRENKYGYIIFSNTKSDEFDLKTLKYKDIVCLSGQVSSEFGNINMTDCSFVKLLPPVESLSESSEETVSSDISSALPEPSSTLAESSAPAEESSDTVISSDSTITVEAPANEEKEQMVWVSSKGKKYHRSSSCSNMKNPYQISLSSAKSQGRSPCSKCY